MSVETGTKEGWIQTLWDRLLVDSIEQSEAASLGHLSRRGSVHEWRVIVVCVVVAVNLSALNYFGMSNRIGWFVDHLSAILDGIGWSGGAQRLSGFLLEGANTRLYSLFFWALSCVTLYFIVPALVVKCVFRQSLAEYGLVMRGAWRHLKIYAVLFAIVLPAVIAVSFTDSFQQQYPFYKDYQNRIPPGFVYWELAYAAQFFALEFFFRGFMVHGLKRRFGFYAVFVMVVPYCMIHFGKPFPETIAAILAGFVLGLLSLRTGTIWPGFLIHVSVAWSMDLAALWQAGLL